MYIPFSKIGTLKMIYIAYFYSVIKYGIIFWVNSTDSKSLSSAKKIDENYERH